MAEIVFVVPSVLNRGGGQKRLQIRCDSVAGAFAEAAKEMGDDFARRVLESDGTPRSLVNIYVNGKNAKFSGGMDAPLNDGDEVSILPAVAGGSGSISERDLDRFSRQVMLEEIGYSGQLRLMNSRACVVGAGGLGNPIISRLAAMGVGRLRIVDRDVIELSNLPRQTMYTEDDVGQVKVEAAARKIASRVPGCRVEALAVSVNQYTAHEVVQNCDVVIDALDSVNARYALNRACIRAGIPFVTGAAVGVSGQAFTVLPGSSACYHCMFPALDEDSMPTCSIEGVHPAVLSIVGGVEVAEAVKVMLGKKPALSDRILHVDIEGMDFATTGTAVVPECPVCGSGTEETGTAEELILEELCGRNRGSRTFSITPTSAFDLDAGMVAAAAERKGFAVDRQGDLGLSLRSETLSVSFMNRGSAVVVGPKDEQAAVLLYNELLGRQDGTAGS